MRKAAALVSLWAVLAACTPKAVDDPVAVMMDQGEAPGPRLAAAEQAEREIPNDERRLAALRELIYAPRHPDEMRIYAIDALVAYHEVEAKAYLRSAIVLLSRWEVIQHLLDVSVERSWTDFAPGIVRNYARPAWAYKDADRPERAALEKLFPQRSVEQTVTAVFVDVNGSQVNERAAAWELLNRLVETEQLMAMLAEMEPTTPLIADLQAGARDLHVLPDTQETVTWLTMLRMEPYAGFWAAAMEAAGKLSDEQRAGLELRHIPLITALGQRKDPRLQASRAELMRQVESYVRSQDHYLKSATYDGGSADHPQALADWRDELSWGDLLVISELIRVMGDRGATGAWFAQADADLADTSTEYGGLLRLGPDGGVIAQPYSPMLRKHDLTYLPPEQLTLDGYAALAHYHFHAQKYGNSQYAGPGRGDLKSVGDTQRYNGVVLTFLDERRLNVDFYRRGGVVVDLGVIYR